MSVSSTCNKVFKIAIDDYHLENSVHAKTKTHLKILHRLKKLFTISVGLIRFSGI